MLWCWISKKDLDWLVSKNFVNLSIYDLCTLHFLLRDVLLLFPEFQPFSLPLSAYLSWKDFLRGCQCDDRELCAVMAFVCLADTTCSCHTHPVNFNISYVTFIKSFYYDIIITMYLVHNYQNVTIDHLRGHLVK